MSDSKHILLLPGDGIGPEVVGEVEKIIAWFNSNGASFTTSNGLLGGIAYDETGAPFPEETKKDALEVDAILLGAVGGPKWESLDISLRPEKGLLGIRKHLDLFANLRPAICFDALADASTLKHEVIAGLDIMIVRELTGGIYFGQPRGVETVDDIRKGVNSLVYHDWEVQRIARVAFDLAQKRNGRLCSVDKANVLECTEMWREEVQKIGDAEFADIELSHMYVDNASMQLVRNPKQFDVVVTTNMFGDILSDCAAMLTGSLGMLPSASLGAEDESGKRPALYEPVHGSAPDIAGQNKANPIATILSFAMMLRYSFDMAKEADLLESAIEDVLAQGYRTRDIMSDGGTLVFTNEMGDMIVQALTGKQGYWEAG
jgi:3-isopropylmalate dehydrogenase